MRDRHAEQRDAAAERRDSIADAFDRRAADLAEEATTNGGDPLEALRAAEALRKRAAEDRAIAAADRQRAAEDRQLAARDREEADGELGRAYVDHLTGAYTRGIGEMALANEITRAKRENTSLVLAFIDVDGLKHVNDSQGHHAGDALLNEVASMTRYRIRPYDPLVRFGGDEFVCALSGLDEDAARERFDEIAAALKRGSISIGLAEMGPEDDLDDLIERSDASLRTAKASQT